MRNFLFGCVCQPLLNENVMLCYVTCQPGDVLNPGEVEEMIAEPVASPRNSKTDVIARQRITRHWKFQRPSVS